MTAYLDDIRRLRFHKVGNEDMECWQKRSQKLLWRAQQLRLHLVFADPRSAPLLEKICLDLIEKNKDPKRKEFENVKDALAVLDRLAPFLPQKPGGKSASLSPWEKRRKINGLKRLLKRYTANPKNIAAFTRRLDKKSFASVNEHIKSLADDIWEANLLLVPGIARKYTGPGFEENDAIQEGNLGLEEAVYRFNPTLGFKFSTYAEHPIKRSILAARNKSRSIYLPGNKIEKIMKMDKAVTRLRNQLQYEPSVEEIAAELGWSAGLVVKIMRTRDLEPSSIDEPSEDGLTPRADFIKSSRSNPYKDRLQSQMAEKLSQALRVLEQSQKDAIEHYYSLEEPNLRDVGKILEVSHETVNKRIREGREKMAEYFRSQGIDGVGAFLNL